MLKALLPLFALASFLMIGLAVPTPADAGGIVQTGYAKDAPIYCFRSLICRPRFKYAQAYGPSWPGPHYGSWWRTH
jgi:hypothetical protein